MAYYFRGCGIDQRKFGERRGIWTLAFIRGEMYWGNLFQNWVKWTEPPRAESTR